MAASESSTVPLSGTPPSSSLPVPLVDPLPTVVPLEPADAPLAVSAPLVATTAPALAPLPLPAWRPLVEPLAGLVLAPLGDVVEPDPCPWPTPDEAIPEEVFCGEGVLKPQAASTK